MSSSGMKASVAAAVLNAIFRNTPYTGPAALWVQLHTGPPGPNGTANIAANTTRHQLTMGAPTTSTTSEVCAGTNGPTWSGAEVVASEDYTFATLWDAVTAGNFQMSGPETSNPVIAGQAFTLPIAQVVGSIPIAT